MEKKPVYFGIGMALFFVVAFSSLIFWCRIKNQITEDDQFYRMTKRRSQFIKDSVSGHIKFRQRIRAMGFDPDSLPVPIVSNESVGNTRVFFTWGEEGRRGKK